MNGTRLGIYEIIAKLGEGGMGEVWRAAGSKPKREVAIKVLPVAFTANASPVSNARRPASTPHRRD